MRTLLAELRSQMGAAQVEASAREARGYRTYRQPEDYVPDWRAFYDDSRTWRERLSTDRRANHVAYASVDGHQVLNVYGPSEGRRCPVVLFFHGGHWREGHPDHYDRLAAPWVCAGALFVSAGYRQMPRYSIHDGIEDVESAIVWVSERIRDFGGDPARVSVAGHSSGAHLLAMALMTPESGLVEDRRDALQAVVCVSPPTDLRDRFGDTEEARTLSPALRASHCPSGTIIAFGDTERNRTSVAPDYYARNGTGLAEALRRVGGSPRVVRLEDHNHLDTVLALGDANSTLYAAASPLVLGP